MDEARLSALERLERAATPGPWVSSVEGRDHHSGDSVILAGAEHTQPDSDIYVSISVAGEGHPPRPPTKTS
jgi:hypothetical protein